MIVCVCVCVCVMLSCFSCVRLCATLWTVSHQAPLSMGFSRQQYWSGLPFPPPGDLPDPGIKPSSQASPTLAGRFFTTSTTWEAFILRYASIISQYDWKEKIKQIQHSKINKTMSCNIQHVHDTV